MLHCLVGKRLVIDQIGLKAQWFLSFHHQKSCLSLFFSIPMSVFVALFELLISTVG